MNSNNQDYNPCLDDVSNAISADDRELVRTCVESILPEAANQVELWLAKAWVCDSLSESEIAILKALEIDPNNQIADSALTWFRGIRALADKQHETRLAAEEEARIIAEEATRIAAEEEARIISEEATRLAAEEEARIIAEEATRIAAEEEARLEENLEIEDSPENHACTTLESELMECVDSLAQEIRDEVESKHEADTTPVSTDNPPQENRMVLAVDDSPTVRKLVSLTLSSEGFEVITANDGIEALNIIAERIPDIILSDINMPKLNGYKLCKFVKKHERTKSIPVVMLSGKDGVFDKMRGKMNGCDDFIAKPFEAADLIEKVRKNLAAAANSKVAAPEIQ